jgi:polysaccharide biosynthesis transport protein
MSIELPETAEPAPAPAGPGLFTILWRRKAYLALGAVVGLAVGYLDYLRRDRVYQSTAQLYVQKRRADPLPVAGATDSRAAFIEDFLATHEALIRSTEVLTLAGRHLEKAPLEKPPIGGDYVGYIASGLAVSRVQTGTGTSANILNISFRGPSPADSEAVVRAVIAGYDDSLSGGVAKVTGEDLKQIDLAQKQIEDELRELEKTYTTVRGEILRKSQMPATDLKTRIGLNEGKKSDLELRKIELDNRLKHVDRAKAEHQDRKILLAYLQRLGGDKSVDARPAASPPDDALAALRQKEDELLQAWGKDHPQVLEVRRKIAALERQAPAAGANGSATDELIEFYVQAIRQEIEAIGIQATFLDESLKKDRSVVQEVESLQLQETTLTDRRDRLRKRLTDLEDRQKQLALTQEARLYEARSINPPGPGVKVAPVLFQCLLLAVVLGLGAGGGLGYLAEVTDKSFRTPDEIRRRLGLAVVGHIPALAAPRGPAGAPTPIEPRVVVHHRPKSTEAEAYRGVRTALYFSTRGKGHQVIQVTSPNPGDGKSTLSANLAVAIAQSGMRVVLIDCDFRKPRLHKIFGVSPDVGLASVIAGDAALDRAIQPSGVLGLSLLPCGPRPANPAELLTSQRFVEVLEEVKKNFDFVLIDTPPLLAVSDPAVVAPRVDGVLLTVRITRKTRPAAERAKEILTAMGANVVGVVVNDLEVGKNGGIYGYGYGYGYRYQYNYGYGYADNYGDPGEDPAEFPQPAVPSVPDPGLPPRHLV